LLPQAHGDLALERKFERVGNEVEDDLLPHFAVDPHRLRKGRAVDSELESCLIGRGAEHARELGRKGRQIDRFIDA
jgi:hypothetical protein